jgi:hypothetical protein
MFRPLDSPQGHEAEDEKDVQGAVESPGQLEMAIQAGQ